MIVCSCNRLNDRQLARTANEMHGEPHRSIVTPGAVFRRLGHRPRCGGCFPLVVKIIHEKEPVGEEARAHIDVIERL